MLALHFGRYQVNKRLRPARVEVEIPFYKEEVQLIKAKVGFSVKGATLI